MCIIFKCLTRAFLRRDEAISSKNGLGVNQIASFLAMTMNNSRLIRNCIPLILKNHDHVSFKMNPDALGCLLAMAMNKRV